jgi:hypothetical protein
MQRIKIFKTVESEIAELEKDVNAWLEETGATIVSLSGNIAPQSSGHDTKTLGLGGGLFSSSDILLIIVYELPDA